MRDKLRLTLVSACFGAVWIPFALRAQIPRAAAITPNLAAAIERPLRYRPDRTDFVIANGAKFLNRLLYGR